MIRWKEECRMTDYDVVIIGAGQAGLAIGYYLKQAGTSFILLDGNEKIGDSWRKRYESLVLFTSRQYSSLPGLQMSGHPEGFPTKNEIANYLEEYACQFQLPVMLNHVVKKMRKMDDRFELITNHGVILARQVVIASGAFQKPFIPPVKKTGEGIQQLHSSEYIVPSQIQEGSVLVVGGGNSGAQIAVELAKERQVTLAISHPFTYLPLRVLGKSIFKWLQFFRLLYAGIDTKRGQWFKRQRDPIFGHKLKQFIAEGKIHIKSRVIAVNGNEVSFYDQTKEVYDAVIWATGFTPNYDWIEIEGAIASNGHPIHERGISPEQGLYYIGLPWQYQRGSALICGVGRDAEYLAEFIVNDRLK